jgi:hypothetical protein
MNELKQEFLDALTGVAPMKKSRAVILLELFDEMGRSDLAAGNSAAAQLIGHMLKWRIQPEKRTASWQDSIIKQRVELSALLDDIPSLENKIYNTWPKTYEKGVKIAMDDTKYPRNKFP